MLRVLAGRAIAITVTALLLPNPAAGQGRGLTLDLIYDPAAALDFSGDPEVPKTWLDDASYVLVTRSDGSRASEWHRVDAETGAVSPLFDQARMEVALAALPSLASGEAAALAYSSQLQLNPDATAALVDANDDLYFYDFDSAVAVRLTSAPGEEELATFSPDGRAVAFVRANDLYMVEIATVEERRLTTDGGPDRLNGKLDWLYQEEIFGRGRFRAYWWSPDSTHIAFLHFDETGVPKYTLVDDVPYRPEPEVTAYPKAGDPNPLVGLAIVSADNSRTTDGALRSIDLRHHADEDILIADVSWTPDGQSLIYQVQDREQRWLDLMAAPLGNELPKHLIRESTPAWVNANGSPLWRDDGTFLWLSERSGFRHLYHYGADGTLLGQLTRGEWNVATFYGVDESTAVLYFASSADNPVGTAIYRLALDGGSPERLSTVAGVHRAIFNPSMTRYVDVWSTATTPTQIRLHDSAGSERRVIDMNQVPAVNQFSLSTPEFVQVPTRDGFLMEGMLIRPQEFDPSRSYPVFQDVYGAPGAPSVRDRWGGRRYLFYQLLAQQGIVVWVLDNRSASGKGAQSQWPVYQRLGELELQDLEDGLSWLGGQPGIDTSRVVLSGWSYGGFLTTYALTHSDRWLGGVAGGAVTDWRDYDTVYTERYMRTPENNPDGYRRSAPRYAAANLAGSLLLIHGAIDDNVHPQNSMQLAYELQRAGKSFELMIYPRARHGVTDSRQYLHLQQTTLAFVLRTVSTVAPESVIGQSGR